MKQTLCIAPVSATMEGLYVGIKEFPINHLILLVPKGQEKSATKTIKALSPFKIPIYTKELKGPTLWESVFQTVSEAIQQHQDKEVIINVATGDKATHCAALSAAFVNGVKAFDIGANGKPMILPILKFSYYKILSDKKLAILKELAKPDCCNSLDMLSKKTKMSMPLISYHINGTLKSEGLKQLGLVETTEHRGRINITISALGRMLMNGYIS